MHLNEEKLALYNTVKDFAKNEIKPAKHHDVPGDWFKGPF